MYICGQTGLEVQLGRAGGQGSSRGCPNKLHSVESTVGGAWPWRDLGAWTLSDAPSWASPSHLREAEVWAPWSLDRC